MRRRWTRIGISLGILLVLFIISGVGYGVYAWTQTQYYIGKDSNKVVIYQGVPTNIFGIALSHKVESTDIPVNKLDKSWQDQLKEGISFGSLVEARGHASLIRREMRAREQEKLNEQNQKKLENKINKNKDNAKQGVKPHEYDCYAYQTDSIVAFCNIAFWHGIFTDVFPY